ncbi:MAG: CehA/McbA family metallohydrolase [Planctomycetes bacterium]|nr:CehA/McbA family metallohydrolase [Planctomycetota bacterium]
MRPSISVFCTLATALIAKDCFAHDHSLSAFQKTRAVAQAKAAAAAEGPTEAKPDQATCQLTIQLIDAGSRKSLPGLVRITRADSGKALPLVGQIAREANWYAVPEQPVVTVPQTTLRIEAVHGLETELCRREIDVTGKSEDSITLPLPRFYDAAERGLRSGNTHLHLMNLTYAEADRYLRVVPKADALDLVYLSYLRRVPDERNYISNEIVANSFAGGDLARLSQSGVLFANGQEHRHNFGRGSEGYGHVMFLDILKLIQPVSIGPGIMHEGTDGIPLQRGIREARSDGAAVIWCHNTFGYEDLPNWMAGLLDAQNIFDGGLHGSYQDTYYRYLNLGLKVPFSTGTDWFIYDFSRVYVPIAGPLTSKKWLTALAAGKSCITNGPFLELQASGHQVGDTVALSQAGSLEITARGIGRHDFRALELVHNGDVIRTSGSRPVEGHFAAEMRLTLDVGEPGWIALRIPLEAGKNEFDKPLYAHTSPIDVELGGQRVFRPQVAEQLIAEMQNNMEAITAAGKFANDDEREAVLMVHREGIAVLRRRLESGR